MTKWVKHTDDITDKVNSISYLPENDSNTLYEINPEVMDDADKQRAMIVVFGSRLADQVLEAMNKAGNCVPYTVEEITTV